MEKQYTIHEVAALLGISADAIRLYEKEELVHPTRNPDNGYRYYNFEQMQQVMAISLYRQLGIGIQKIRQIMQQGALPSVAEQFDQVIEENEKEILALRTRVEKMRYMRQHLTHLMEGLDTASVAELQDCYILYHQDVPKLQYHSMKQIMTSEIFSFGNLCRGIVQGADGLYSSRSLEFIVRSSMIDLTPWKESSENLPLRKSCPCIYMVVKTTDAANEKWDLRKMWELAEKQGLQCSREGYAFYVFSLQNGQEIENYFEIYLPIVQKY